MDCDNTRGLLHAYVDGELDLVRSLEIEQHLQGCAACLQMWKNQQMLKASFAEATLYVKPPPHLQARIQASIRGAGKANPAPRTIPWRLFAFAAALVLAVALVPMLARVLSPSSSKSDSLAQEVVASHVRSLMANHLSDVASSDQHTVKPWFNGKLDFSPPVEDLSAQGFPLIGGRLDYLNDRPVAALIYQRRKHFINLFIWPTTDNSAVAAQMETLQGYHVYHWTQPGMTFWATSDLNTTELQQFVQLAQSEGH